MGSSEITRFKKYCSCLESLQRASKPVGLEECAN